MVTRKTDGHRRRASGQNRPGSAEDKGSGCSRVNIRVERERRRETRDGGRSDRVRARTRDATGAHIEDGGGIKDTTARVAE